MESTGGGRGGKGGCGDGVVLTVVVEVVVTELTSLSIVVSIGVVVRRLVVSASLELVFTLAASSSPATDLVGEGTSPSGRYAFDLATSNSFSTNVLVSVERKIKFLSTFSS